MINFNIFQGWKYDGSCRVLSQRSRGERDRGGEWLSETNEWGVLKGMVEGCKEIRDEMIMKMKENLKENEKMIVKIAKPDSDSHCFSIRECVDGAAGYRALMESSISSIMFDDGNGQEYGVQKRIQRECKETFPICMFQIIANGFHSTQFPPQFPFCFHPATFQIC